VPKKTPKWFSKTNDWFAVWEKEETRRGAIKNQLLDVTGEKECNGKKKTVN